MNIQIIRIAKKSDFLKDHIRMLQFEFDYELLTLNEAINSGDEKQRAKSNLRCKEIYEELNEAKNQIFLQY